MNAARLQETPPLPLSRRFKGTRIRLAVAGFLLAVVGLVVHQASYWYWTSDDAFITFRYSENLANGLGAVFNPGEKVEGYTNFLWMIILSAFYRAGVNIVLTAKLLGAACAIVTLFLSAALTRYLQGRWTLAAIITPMLLASTPSYTAWSVAGLETSLFTMLITVAVWRFSVEQERSCVVRWSGMLLALASMTRPEGVLIFLLLLGFSTVRAAVRERSSNMGVAGQELRWVLMFLAIAAPYMVWRWSYYGYLFPNTFYVKSGRGLAQTLGGVLYVTAGIRKHGGMLFHILALVPAIWGPLRARAAPFVIVILGWQLYDVYKGNDVLELFRFFVPILPLVYSLAVVALVQLYELAEVYLPARGTTKTLLALFVAGTVATNLVMSYASRDQRIQLKEYQLQIRIDEAEFRLYARRLLEIAPDGASIALLDAGVIPYVTRWYTIDRFGLCDVYIAHSKPRGRLGEKFDAAYVLSRQPVFIQTKVSAQMEEKGQIHLGWPGDAELFANARFRKEYVRLEDPELDGFFVRREMVSQLRLGPHTATGRAQERQGQ